jgi:uncharacterized protein with von Willebrand factor type A (vWA) domain
MKANKLDNEWRVMLEEITGRELSLHDFVKFRNDVECLQDDDRASIREENDNDDELFTEGREEGMNESSRWMAKHFERWFDDNITSLVEPPKGTKVTAKEMRAGLQEAVDGFGGWLEHLSSEARNL